MTQRLVVQVNLKGSTYLFILKVFPYQDGVYGCIAAFDTANQSQAQQLSFSWGIGCGYLCLMV
jgi:hypothetical protein